MQFIQEERCGDMLLKLLAMLFQYGILYSFYGSIKERVVQARAVSGLHIIPRCSTDLVSTITMSV
jgi:hypothetical protein